MQVHRWTGIAFALVLLPVAVTGVLLAFQYELQQYWAPEEFDLAIPADGRVDPVAMAASLTREFPDSTLSGLYGQRGTSGYPFRAQLVGADEHYRDVFINPYTGELIRARGGEAFWNFLRDLHVHLLVPLFGTFTVLASGVILIITSLVGIVLWWPKLRRPKLAFGIRWKAGAWSTMVDLHNVLGLYLLLPMVIISLTGVTLILGRFDAAPPPPDVALTVAPPVNESLPQAMAILGREAPDAAVWQIRFPSERSPWYLFDVSSPASGDSTLLIGAAGEGLLRRSDGRDGSLWARLKGELGVALHEGYIAGTAGKWIVLICGLTLTFGVISGVWLWLKRRNRARRPSARKPGRAVISR
ncbi:PepSY-associated TM helix domain-containing protein [Lentisalinibacter sediminis]|uniref:PepSY-associated TM helix domain-containing protein n=1 Tax=Lentisalinibacter sediminis TaxID=2992237 RepID=UPI00386B4FB2